MALSQPPLLIGPPKLASVWFGQDERSVATSIAALSNLLGMLLSFVLGPFIVTQGSEFILLYLIEASFATLISVLTIILFRGKPASPPSASAHAVEEPLLKSLKHLVQQKNYILLTLVFGLGYGVFSGLFTVLDQVVEPQGYSKNDSGFFGIVMLGSGIVGGGLAGVILDKTRAYRPTMLTLYAGSGFALTVFYLSLYSPNILPHTQVCRPLHL